MLSSALALLQLIFSGIIAYCFFSQYRASTGRSPAKARSYSREMDNLAAMRRVSLTQPLNEAVRPRCFGEIIGQDEALRALTAILCSPNPQHVIIYGPPGVGKTCAARVALEEAKRCANSPFRPDAPFVEVDATTVRFDERAIADPLIGSVHDPIYQGAGSLGAAGVPQPKLGAVSRAHGGVLFIDEIGELHPIQMNKLLKVLEDRRVMLESAYYDRDDTSTPAYVHDIFQHGVPADFRLIGATTRDPDSIPPAIRSRCMELYFKPLDERSITAIAGNAAARAGISIDKDALGLIGRYASGGRDAANMVQVAAGFAMAAGRSTILADDMRSVITAAGYTPRPERRVRAASRPGLVNGLAVAGAGCGFLLWIDAVAVRGSGGFTVTGIIDEEELGGRGKSVRRRSQASSSVANVRTALRRAGVELGEWDVHVDFPGGVPVDGPSAGVAMALACYGAVSGEVFDPLMAVTGELSIGGDAMPVGGIREKLAAAQQAGARRVLLPEGNLSDAADCPHGVEICSYRDLSEAISLARPRPALAGGVPDGAVLSADGAARAGK